MKEIMPKMMSQVMPHCLAVFLPVMPSQQKAEFITKLDEAVNGNRDAQGQ